MEIISNYSQYFISGIGYTILLSGLGVIFGSILGVVLVLAKLSSTRWLQLLSSSIIAFLRGTPLMIQMMIIYYGLPLNLDMVVAGVAAMSINSAAYIAEILRAGLNAVDIGQYEAAKSLGMSKWQMMRYIIFPQAFKNILPALGNEFIVLIKESAIVSVIGVHDLMYNADIVRSISYDPFTPLVLVAIIYFAMTYSLSKGMTWLERRMSISDRS